MSSPVHYINLATRPDRDRAFRVLNSGICRFERVEGTVGSELDRGTLIRDGILGDTLEAYGPGALGNAISHVSLWEQAASANGITTIAEDDAIFNRQFSIAASQVLDQLPPDWEIVFWGWNLDSIVHVQMVPQVHQAVLRFEPQKLGERISDFQNAIYDVLPLRLLNEFGLVCYSLSAHGARHLRRICCPLKTEEIAIAGLGRKLQNYALDIALNAHYQSLNAYVCFPPLVHTENDWSTSDVISSSGKPH